MKEASQGGVELIVFFFYIEVWSFLELAVAFPSDQLGINQWPADWTLVE